MGPGRATSQARGAGLYCSVAGVAPGGCGVFVAGASWDVSECARRAARTEVTKKRNVGLPWGVQWGGPRGRRGALCASRSDKKESVSLLASCAQVSRAMKQPQAESSPRAFTDAFRFRSKGRLTSIQEATPPDHPSSQNNAASAPRRSRAATPLVHAFGGRVAAMSSRISA